MTKQGWTPMALYFFSYDANNEKDYQRLYDDLDRREAIKIADTTWRFKDSGTNCEDLREHFEALLDENDSFVISVVSDWAARVVPKDIYA